MELACALCFEHAIRILVRPLASSPFFQLGMLEPGSKHKLFAARAGLWNVATRILHCAKLRVTLPCCEPGSSREGR